MWGARKSCMHCMNYIDCTHLRIIYYLYWNFQKPFLLAIWLHALVVLLYGEGQIQGEGLWWLKPPSFLYYWTLLSQYVKIAMKFGSSIVIMNHNSGS